MAGARPRADRRRAPLALAALVALALPAAAAGHEPVEDAALALDAAETRVRELQRVVAGHAARLGVRPPVLAEPETLEGLAVRAAELEAVAAFLAARREVLRIRPRPGTAGDEARPLRRGGRDDVARLAERLGLDRPPAPAAEKRAADEARMAAVASWLAAGAEVPRAAEAPMLWPARGRVDPRGGVRWGRDGEEVDIAVPAGGAAVAAAAGRVARAAAGGTVVVRHAGGLVTVYAVLDGVRVAPGQAIARGQVIGRVAGSRLHFAIRAGGAPVDARDHVRPPGRRPIAPPPQKAALAAGPPDAGGPAPDCPAPGGPPGSGLRASLAEPAGFACEPAAGGYSRKLSRSSTRTPMSSR